MSKPGKHRRRLLHRLKLTQQAAEIVVAAIGLTGIVGAAYGIYRMAATIAT